MDIDQLEFKCLNQLGVNTLVDWAAEEGWNPGIHDAWLFYQADPDGFFGCYHDGEMIAGGSIVSYNGEFGFMGLFIVKPEYRSRGIGRQLWFKRRDMLLSRLKDEAPIGMDGVVGMQPFYNQGGFEIAFRDERYERIGREYSVSEKVCPLGDDSFGEASDLDRRCFGFARPQFLKPWLNQPDSKSFQYRTSGGLQGFVLMRKAKDGYKIGPLFADNSEVAEDLYKACLDSAIDEPVYLDIPVSNSDAVAMVKKFEAEYVFECARMYYGSSPKVELENVFGITTFELG